MKMNFEHTFGRQNEKIALEQERANYEKFTYWSEKLNQGLKISMAALMLAQTPLRLKNQSEVAYVETKQPTKIEQVETDAVPIPPLTQTDGTEVRLEYTSEGGLPVAKVLSPENGGITKRILFFPQKHDVDAEFLQSYSTAEKLQKLEETLSSQKSIYKTLTDAVEKQGLKKVCVEGLLDTDDIDDLVESYRRWLPSYVADLLVPYFPAENELVQAVRKNDQLHADGDFSAQDLKILKEEIEPIYQNYVNEYKYIIGGARILAMEGKIELCGAETKATYDAIWENKIYDIIDKKPLSEMTSAEYEYRYKLTYTDRENAALWAVSQQKESTIALVYGRAHDFTDNLEQWNDVNNDQKFEMIQYYEASELDSLGQS